MNCYNEYGKAAYVKLSQGKLVAKKGGEIKVVFADNADPSKVAVIKENGTIGAGYTTAAPIDTANQAREGGIPLIYAVNNQPVTEETVGSIAESAVEELAGEEVAEQNQQGANYVARIGAQGYESFKAACENAQAGQTIYLLKDCTIDETIGGTYMDQETVIEYSWLDDDYVEGTKDVAKARGVNNKVVLTTDVTFTFKNSAQIYMSEDASFEMNGHTLGVLFDSSCASNEYSGFMNCTLWKDYHGLHAEHWEYDFENTSASGSIYVDFFAEVPETLVVRQGLVYHDYGFYIMGGASGIDNYAYDEQYAAYIYNNGESDGKGMHDSGSRINEGYVTRLYVASGEKNYVWKTYNSYGVGELTESSQHIRIKENNGSWIVAEGILGDGPGSLNGYATTIEVTITHADDSTTTYRWIVWVATVGGSGEI